MSWQDILKGREEQDFYMDMYGTHTPQDAKRGFAPSRCETMFPLGNGSYERCDNPLRTKKEREDMQCRYCTEIEEREEQE